MSDETCPKPVYDHGGWRSHACGKPIKRRGLCGIHAAAEERVEKNNQARDRAKAEAQTVVDRLAAHGVRAWVNFDGTARISMTPEALADHLDAKEARP